MFDTNRAAIRNLYQDNSMLTFEGEKFQGVEAISQKLNGLQFQTVEHEIVTSDYQPTNGGGILVFVCGHLKVDGSEHPMKFSQVFSLMPLPGGQGYYCFNDVFRLIYG
uniref:NTF2 domain-containing protein n=1 Tax=Hanusia phi TaxID=3032 RepID=A0A7S0EKA9_9CRYP|mmetsp:Transcript_25338/g.57097  ORF Transcript_25338/g.57097 Transcript_25338/m.57097 type:complete len:108 (+) Transcript_25338:207-530(+)